MSYFRFRRVALCAVALAAGASLSGVAFAQEGPKGRIETVLDENGINLSQNFYTVSPTFTEPAVSIGTSENGGLSLMRTLSNTGTANPWGHNFNYKVNFANIFDLSGTGVDAYTSVTGGNIRDDFEGNCTGTCTSRLGTGGTLIVSPTQYTYMARDGTAAVFEKRQVPNEDFTFFSDVPLAVGTSVTKPNGEKLTLTYFEYVNGGNIARRRVSSVQSNFGYQIKFYYATDVGDSGSNSNNTLEWHRLTKTVAINNAIDYCDPAATNCSGFSQSWPQSTYSVPSTSVDAGGVVRTYPAFAGTSQFLRGSPGTVVATFSFGANTTVTTVDGTSSYTGSQSGFDRYATGTIQRTNPQGGVRTAVMSQYAGKPLTITDENNRSWKFQYDTFDRLIYAIPPEGTVSGTSPPTAGYTKNDYDARGNIVQVTQVPKAGSGLANIVTYAGYDTTCANPKTCNQPNWTKDATGNQTDFTYDLNHGGVLSAMKPAPTTGAARPLVVNTYAQRSAWIKNASGTLVQSPDPVWLPATRTECQTAAGGNTPTCDASAQQTVTTYEYGSSGAGEAMLVKGIVVSSGGVTLRTCNRYDIYHHKIGETTPNANLGACP